MQDFRVSLNSTTNVFFANSEVTGTVYLKTEEPLKARKIQVSIVGRAKAAFSQLRGSTSYYYCSTQPYIEIEQILWKCDGDENKIASGNYEFPFKFIIPIICPPNISGLYGNIKYYVKANIDVPWSFDKNFVAGFSVCPYIDLNIDIRLSSPVINYIEKTKLFSSKAVKATLKMPKMGFVCGETIPLQVLIENESTSEVTSVESGIGATYFFTAKLYGSNAFPKSSFMNHTVTKEISKKYGFENIPLSVGVNQSAEFNRDIQIPPVPPSFDHCEIIKLQYHVFVKVHTSAIFSRGATASMPIVIGTVPLRQMMATVVEPNFIGLEAYMQPPAPGIPPPDYDFHDASFCDGDPEEKSEIKEDDEDFAFQPKFAYYSDKTKLLNWRQ